MLGDAGQQPLGELGQPIVLSRVYVLSRRQRHKASADDQSLCLLRLIVTYVCGVSV
jgi:hypothetical protein